MTELFKLTYLAAQMPHVNACLMVFDGAESTVLETDNARTTILVTGFDPQLMEPHVGLPETGYATPIQPEDYDFFSVSRADSLLTDAVYYVEQTFTGSCSHTDVYDLAVPIAKQCGVMIAPTRDNWEYEGAWFKADFTFIESDEPMAEDDSFDYIPNDKWSIQDSNGYGGGFNVSRESTDHGVWCLLHPVDGQNLTLEAAKQYIRDNATPSVETD